MSQALRDIHINTFPNNRASLSDEKSTLTINKARTTSQGILRIQRLFLTRQILISSWLRWRLYVNELKLQAAARDSKVNPQCLIDRGTHYMVPSH